MKLTLHRSSADTVRGSNPGGGEIFHTRTDRPWGTPSLLYNGSFLGVKRPGLGVDHPPPSRAEVEERVELYIWSPSGPSWTVLERISPSPSPSAEIKNPCSCSLIALYSSMVCTGTTLSCNAEFLTK